MCMCVGGGGGAYTDEDSVPRVRQCFVWFSAVRPGPRTAGPVMWGVMGAIRCGVRRVREAGGHVEVRQAQQMRDPLFSPGACGWTASPAVGLPLSGVRGLGPPSPSFLTDSAPVATMRPAREGRLRNFFF